MAHLNSVMTGIELEQLMDRLEAECQENDAQALLTSLRAQPLKADSMDSVDRLHVLWMNAGDSQAAQAVLEQDAPVILEALPVSERSEPAMNLAIMRLRLANFLEDEPTLLAVLETLHERVAQPLEFDVEYYRQHHTFDDIEYAGVEVALKAIDVRAALANAISERRALRAWDLADQYQRRARVLARNNRDEEARTAALQAVAALRSAGPDQDIDAGDWMWLGGALIEIIPLRLAMFEQPVAHLTAGLSVPVQREWEVRMARLAARALYAQGNLAKALEICSVATLCLDCDGSNNFIHYQLPWLMESGDLQAAGRRAFTDVYFQFEDMWPGTANLIHERLQDLEDQQVWWPLCVMRACIRPDVLQALLSGLTPVDASATTPLLEALHLAAANPGNYDNLYAQARAEAQRRGPQHPWFIRLAAVHDGDAGLIDAPTQLALLLQAIEAGGLHDFRTANSLFDARLQVYGVVGALKQPMPMLASGKDAYNHAITFEETAAKTIQALPEGDKDDAYILLAEVQRAIYEQGLAHMERYFATGVGHPFDACAHLYSMLCNNLAIKYRYAHNRNLNNEAIALHRRGLDASPFAEHHNGILDALDNLHDHPGIIEAGEQLWHYANEFGYSRHDPDDYVGRVIFALYSEDRMGEILIWIERLFKWQAQQGISDYQLSVWSVFTRLDIARFIATTYPENADALWQRYAPFVNTLNDGSLTLSAAKMLEALGRKAEAIDYYERAMAIGPKDEDPLVIDAHDIAKTLQKLRSAESAVTKSWWQIWK